eukprot:CAMPEP_0184325476 /NCGR_PEP_ID=MMETSP1049-20130417/140574_1 /TAXON_ID=77928 /ORGANISM="Proteomonas sulcata, Strain CCMP704" /LENGTH=54 /DNA_ID=CAMNT_0026647541 /DNA_START=22 /DNA_END=182 /DNA_ORIENTATION=+
MEGSAMVKSESAAEMVAARRSMNKKTMSIRKLKMRIYQRNLMQTEAQINDRLTS